MTHSPPDIRGLLSPSGFMLTSCLMMQNQTH